MRTEVRLMLNEIKEYEEYTCDLCSNDTVRFVPEIFKWKNRMSGLGRAMTIIARKELTDRGYFLDCTDNSKENIRNNVRQVLIEWLGFDNENEEKTSNYNSWLKEYYISNIENSNDDTPIKTWSDFEKKKKQYSQKMFDKKITEQNTMLAITYDKVIADAIFWGSLREYYLVCKVGYEKGLTKNGKIINTTSSVGEKRIESVLKLISAYLVKKTYTGNVANLVSKTELAHWTRNKSIFKGGYFKGIRYKGNDLVTNKTIANNSSKIIIFQEYLDDYDFHLVAREEFESVSEGYVFFSDYGAAFPLQLGKYYE